ncbi:tetratricopeptide repeat protein [Acidocella sp.]|uniref:tetratricopeptide repeat protein n=1 Tax=Acidocella sp. TaxID=50710 RepID=UPI0026067131|nr:tetratricopeptide repeat protein [Acidocella sp.]
MPLSAAEALAALERDAGNVAALAATAEILHHGGEGAAAIALLRQGLALAPGNARLLRGLSGFLVAAGQAEEAEPLARAAAAHAPGQPEYQLHHAHVLFACARPAAAEAPLLAALAHMPENAAAWSMLATCNEHQGRLERALAAAAEAARHAPDNLGYALQRAALLNARACHGDALAVLTEAMAHKPEDPHLARALSGVHEMLGNLPAAFAEAERACALAPEISAYRAHCAALAARIGVAVAHAPPGWEPPAKPLRRLPPPRPRPPLAARLAERGRIIWALALREMRTRHSRAVLGYLWAVAEPISHLLTLGVMFAYVNLAPPPLGHSLFEFYCTGLLPYLLFSHVADEVMHARNAAGALLLLPGLRTTDIMAARLFLQFMTEIAVALLVFGAFGLMGYRTMPAAPLTALLAFALLALLGAGVGAVNLVLVNYFHGWETVFNAVIRLLYFASGIYYTPLTMPDQLRAALVWNPVLQGVELFRAGFYPEYRPIWLNLPYLLAWVGGALVLGLGLELGLRRRLRPVS